MPEQNLLHTKGVAELQFYRCKRRKIIRQKEYITTIFVIIIFTMEREHYLLVFAIEMWVKTLITLCDENCTSSHTFDYRYFIANVLVSNNPSGEIEMKQAIDDFYDYFYTNQHICDINHMRALGEIDNNYGTSNTKLRILDLLKKIENNEQSKLVFQTITIYVFQLCCSLRKELDLPIFEDKEKDQCIVSYFTRKL